MRRGAACEKQSRDTGDQYTAMTTHSVTPANELIEESVATQGSSEVESSITRPALPGAALIVVTVCRRALLAILVRRYCWCPGSQTSRLRLIPWRYLALGTGCF